jgi:predicted enzyme related to lactoylglutathione lyase
MLVQERNKEPKGKGVVLNLTVEQIEEYYERALSERAVIVEKPIKRPWNAYELLLADYDGYLITLSMRLDQEKGFEEIVKDVIG